MISYHPLFDILNRRNMKLTDLRNILSSATIAKFRKGGYVSGEVIDKICLYLQCQPNDIMRVEYEKKIDMKGGDCVVACRMCDNARVNVNLNSDNDYSAVCIADSLNGNVRMVYCSGADVPPRIEFDMWDNKMHQWSTYACYYPRFCPNCGREIVEYEEEE